MRKTIVLGTEGIASLKQELIRAKNRMPNIVDKVAQETAEYGADKLSQLAPLSAKYDGNYSGSVEFVPTATGYMVTYSGEQVAYIEFGTGIDAVGSYPDVEILDKANWLYDVNEHGEKGWFYNDHRTGKLYHSVGMIAHMPVYRASRMAEQELPNIVRKVMDEEFN